MHTADATGLPDNFFPVILAGGSGTRFWPRSRRKSAKQVLALDGERTMIQQTFDRLLHVASADRVWIVANEGVAGTIRSQITHMNPQQLVCEPAARNTAPACGLLAYLIAKQHPDAVLGIFPSDHVVGDTAAFADTIRRGVALARSSAGIVVLGVPAEHPETGYGYIEMNSGASYERHQDGVAEVLRFTEKPDYETACRFVAAGRYAWNSGMFLWSARTLCQALQEHAPQLASLLERIAEAHGTPRFEKVFQQLYPECQSISVDYAVLEPRSRKGAGANIFCLPANFGWNDLGSWSALYQHHRSLAGRAGDANVVESSASINIEARGNYVYAPGRHVALLGVENLVVVLTDDAVLITTQNRSQEVGQIVKQLTLGGHLQLT